MTKKEPKNKKINKKNTYLSTRNIALFWLAIILLGWIFGGEDLAIGLLIAGIISYTIMYFTLKSSWEGKIYQIKTEQVAQSGTTEDDHIHYKSVNYAYIKLENGKTKKIQTRPNWRVGDKIKKEKGTISPKKI